MRKTLRYFITPEAPSCMFAPLRKVWRPCEAAILTKVSTWVRPILPQVGLYLDPRRGERLMQRLAAGTGGATSPLAGDLFGGERESVRYRALSKELALAALLLLLVEIAGRRLQLWGRGETTERLSREERAARAAHRRRARAAQRVEERASEAATVAESGAEESAGRGRGERAQTADMAEALERARHEASRRLRD